jgi:hypothetical protein
MRLKMMMLRGHASDVAARECPCFGPGGIRIGTK